MRLLGRHASGAPRGQSLVEFGLVLPLLVFILLGVADLGRVFADGVALESAVRNTAEAAAQEYLQLCAKNASSDPLCTGGLSQSDYNSLHALALDTGCREAERLTNRQVSGGGACTNPRIAVCVHDNAAGDANGCGQEGATGNVPANCTTLNNSDGAHPWSAVRAGPADGRPYVEVRMCYHFSALLPVTEFWWGSIWLQKENDFSVTNY
jgi:hypothetical protein